MRRIRGASNAIFIGARVNNGASKPSVEKLVLGWRFFHLFCIMRIFEWFSTLIQLLSVHISVRSHRTAFQRSIHPQRQMPRVHDIFSVHRSVTKDRRFLSEKMNSLNADFPIHRRQRNQKGQSKYPSPFGAYCPYSCPKCPFGRCQALRTTTSASLLLWFTL